MARKIEREEALDRALTLFWDRGYRGTSMDMLTSTLGVEKPSVYASFGSKQKLYLETLLQYRQLVLDSVQGMLDEAPDARAGLDATIRKLMARGGRTERKGCFATNSALELGDEDLEAQTIVRDTFAALTTLFRKTIQRGQAEGTVRSDWTAEVLAQYLVNGIEGARIMERTKASNRAMDQVAALTLSILDLPNQQASRG
ncbi:TetR/AcrR family transcriptional regulator [Nevskia ramosa]|uniref:TetR/AcrR family transcriptional regulator n=1 Tax=Nevskia ramosa TaxID=64002 RepID=UPI0023577EB1|nr:TetR/AcrR family transcriptional regulator [Nevskia ramosa]